MKLIALALLCVTAAMANQEARRVYVVSAAKSDMGNALAKHSPLPKENQSVEKTAVSVKPTTAQLPSPKENNYDEVAVKPTTAQLPSPKENNYDEDNYDYRSKAEIASYKTWLRDRQSAIQYALDIKTLDKIEAAWLEAEKHEAAKLEEAKLEEAKLEAAQNEFSVLHYVNEFLELCSKLGSGLMEWLFGSAVPDTHLVSVESTANMENQTAVNGYFAEVRSAESTNVPMMQAANSNVYVVSKNVLMMRAANSNVNAVSTNVPMMQVANSNVHVVSVQYTAVPKVAGNNLQIRNTEDRSLQQIKYEEWIAEMHQPEGTVLSCRFGHGNGKHAGKCSYVIIKELQEKNAKCNAENKKKLEGKKDDQPEFDWLAALYKLCIFIIDCVEMMQHVLCMFGLLLLLAFLALQLVICMFPPINRREM